MYDMLSTDGIGSELDGVRGWGQWAEDADGWGEDAEHWGDAGDWGDVPEDDWADTAEDWEGPQQWAESGLDRYAEVLRGALREDLADLDAEDLHEALSSVATSLSPAESLTLSKALQQIGRGAGRLVSDPAFVRTAGAALPLVGGAVGTAVGGPAGTALGSTLGTAVARSMLPGVPAAPRAAVTAPAAGPSALVGRPGVAPAGGSDAALMALLLGQHRNGVLGTLAAALGDHGRSVVNGIPVASLLRALSSLYGQAAADADELMWLRQGADGATGGEQDAAEDPDQMWSDRAVYSAVMDAEDDDLIQGLGAW